MSRLVSNPKGPVRVGPFRHHGLPDLCLHDGLHRLHVRLGLDDLLLLE